MLIFSHTIACELIFLFVKNSSLNAELVNEVLNGSGGFSEGENSRASATSSGL